MGHRKHLAIAFATTLVLAGCGQAGEAPAVEAQQVELTDPVPIPDYVTAAIADPAREYHFPRDERRMPGELIAFSGLQPGDRVLDLIPGGGYWTRLFSLVVGEEGHVYATWPENYARFARSDVRRLRELVESDPFTNVTVTVQPTPDLSAPEQLDMVWTSQNYHDYPDEFMGNYDPARLNAAVFEMLRPGGTYFIIDHAAEDGSGMRDTEALHRIDPAAVRTQVEAAGFEFVGESQVLRNPEDDHSIEVFDEQVRGNTDLFVMRFRKPE
jgi:predicted methyltransferase